MTIGNDGGDGFTGDPGGEPKPNHPPAHGGGPKTASIPAESAAGGRGQGRAPAQQPGPNDKPGGPNQQQPQTPSFDLLGGIKGAADNYHKWTQDHGIFLPFTGEADPEKHWDDLRHYGSVLNAFFDPNAIKQSVQKIEHDSTMQGHISKFLLEQFPATSMLGQDANPFARWWNEEALPTALVVGGQWEPWMWAPALAAQIPDDPAKVPDFLRQATGLDQAGKDFGRAAPTDPAWWMRMGGYVFAAVIGARFGARGAQNFIKLSRTIPGMEKFGAGLDRVFNGPTGRKLPIELGDGAHIDHEYQPEEYAAYKALKEHLDAVEAGSVRLAAGQKEITAEAAAETARLAKLQEDLGEKKFKVVGDPIRAREQSVIDDLARRLGMDVPKPAPRTPEYLAARAAHDELRGHLKAAEAKVSMLADAHDAWDEPKPASSFARLDAAKFEVETLKREVAAAKKAIPALEKVQRLTPEQVKGQLWLKATAGHVDPKLSKRIIDHWLTYDKALGLRQDIRLFHPDEPEVGNAISHFADMKPDLVPHAQAAYSDLNALVSDVKGGLSSFTHDDALVTTLAKGILGVSREYHHFASSFAANITRMLPTVADGRMVVDAIENPDHYEMLDPHRKAAVDMVRQIIGTIGDQGMKSGWMKDRQPRYVPRVFAREPRLEQALATIDDATKRMVKRTVEGAKGRLPLTAIRQKHRVVQLAGGLTEDGEATLFARTAYRTVHDANKARQAWRDAVKADIQERADAGSVEHKQLVADPAKLAALVNSEIPLFSTDIREILDAALEKHISALMTHKTVELAKRTLVQGSEKDERMHPLVVQITPSGGEANPELSAHFKSLHNASTTANYYRGQMGYKPVEGLGGNVYFHPALADPLNRAIAFHGGLGDGAYSAMIRLTKGGQHLIMLNPAWHGVNMLGRAGVLAFDHPVYFLQALAKTPLFGRFLGKASPEELAQLFNFHRREFYRHGGLPPRLNDDVSGDIAKFHMNATGDLDAGEGMAAKAITSDNPFAKTPALANAWGWVQGKEAWWQHHVNDHLWSSIDKLATVAYMVEKHQALDAGVNETSARLIAASRANGIAGMISPDRWMYNPQMYRASQLLMFAPNWWRSFPRTLMGTYDRMGVNDPNLAAYWAQNFVKGVMGAMLFKYATDNLLNYLGSGHWQSENDPGYRNQIVLDRFAAVDPKTGAHVTMEPFLTRQMNDLEKVTGLDHAFAGEGWSASRAAEQLPLVGSARQSVLMAAITTASNYDLYHSLKSQGHVWVDPQHPGIAESPLAILAALAQFTPFAFAARDAIAKLGAAGGKDQTLTDGPWKGTKVPAWASSAWDLNHPLFPLTQLAGVRTPYATTVNKEGGAALSSDQAKRLDAENTDYVKFLNSSEAAVRGGQKPLYTWQVEYHNRATQHRLLVQGIVGNESQHKYGAAGVLAAYEGLYTYEGADGKVQGPDGEINYALLNRKREELQAKTDPATWQLMNSMLHARELHHPVLKVYNDTVAAYGEFQTTWAKQHNVDPQQLRDLLHQSYQSPDYRRFEAANPILIQFAGAKRQWEMTPGVGMLYGMFTNNTYVMRWLEASGDVATEESQIMAGAIGQEEAAGVKFTPEGGG